MKKIIYNGYYGSSNTGDDAFIEVCAWGAKEYWGTTRNYFLGSELPETLYPKIEVSKPKFKGHRSLQTALLLHNADMFISAGGSTFNKHIKGSIKDVALLSKRFVNKSLHVGAIGVSIGPFKTTKDESDVVRYLKNIDFIALRDKRSYEYAKSLHLPYEPIEAFDLAALLPAAFAQSKDKMLCRESSKKIVGISICNNESYIQGDLAKEEKRNNFIITLLKELRKEQNIIFRFFIFNGNPVVGDKHLTEHILKHLDTENIEVIPYLKSVKKAWLKIKECDLMISTRLHASIFACYAGLPFFLVEYHRKCTDFLDDVGQSPIYRIGDGEISPSIVVERIKNILYDREYVKPVYIDDTLKKAKRNFTNII